MSASRRTSGAAAQSPHVWGATEAECAAHYPCDDLGFAHDAAFFRALDIDAPPSLVYRWLAQLRVAPYSYDWLDNFGRRSPPALVPGLDRLAPGQRLMTIFRLASFEPGSSLTIVLASRAGRSVMGDFAGTYRVSPVARGSRLVAKVLVRYPRGAYGALVRPVLPHADLMMFRKQLLTLRRYAERDARATSAGAGRPFVR